MSRPIPWLPAAHTEGEALAYRKGYAAGLAAGQRQAEAKIMKRIAQALTVHNKRLKLIA